MQRNRNDWFLYLFLAFILLLIFYPLLQMIVISFKSQGQYTVDPIGVTFPLRFTNYTDIAVVLFRPIFNTSLIAVVSIAGTLTVASLSAYVFARYSFPGSTFLFFVVISLLMIPGLLTLVPAFVVVARLGLLNTYWAAILPYVAGGQVFAIFVLRTFFASLPQELVEAALVDGAGRWHVFWRIVVPLSRPILATLAVLELINVWNDYIWPLITLSGARGLRTLTVHLYFMNNEYSHEWGLIMAGYTIASIPLLLVFSMASQTFVRGLTSGAIKM
jgi:ABC-type glycerol-3-phosphate transport system permease component